MTEQPIDAVTLVPEPTPAPEQLTRDEILDFDAAATVAATRSTAPQYAAPAAPLAPPPAVPVPVSASAATSSETCPSCGTTAAVAVARRDARDFCAKCDYPLFWARDRVVLPSSGALDEAALRRLPGTAGRTLIASFPCPSCDEPNAPAAVNCLRCGAPLHPEPVREPDPEPVMVYVPEPEPEPQRSWWPYIVAAVAALVALAAVLVVAYR